MSDLRIRLARREDVPAIVALLADDMLGKGREDASDLERYYAAFDAMDVEATNNLYVVETDALPVAGTFQLIYMQGLSLGACKRAEIEAVRVHADLRGQGMGTRMFDWAIEKARADGCRLFQLTTNKTRDDGQRFYDQLGFEASHVGYKMKL
ncbi:MAG TPA: GNAT family N-acetyltransferase [Rhizobiales bacterium]|nr:GNAT family N-acetyltransferase [Hyphomicrobiales bacterium]